VTPQPVAYPDLVAVAQEAFDAVLGEQPNQIERTRDDVDVTASELLDAAHGSLLERLDSAMVAG